MTRGDDGSTLRLAARDWIFLIVALIGHSVFVFSCLQEWTTRIVSAEGRITSVEGRVTVVENTLTSGMNEVRADIKEILKRTAPGK